jgi:D-glycero-alpha-D-manno-heptose-7-phosphate kinase
MIITRTPFRISFAGGGSDFESFYREEPGVVISTAINKYMYLTVKERFGNTFRVSYSKTEIRDSVEQIEHRAVRECLRTAGTRNGLEITSIGDLPAQSGMGSSSSFTVGLLYALHSLQGHSVSPERLAQEACHIEIDLMGEPIGKQDQYIAAYGGLQLIQFHPDGRVSVDPVVCKPETKRELNRRLLLFYTGTTRAASDILSKQATKVKENRNALRRLCEIAFAVRDVFTSGNDLNEFGRLLHAAWECKKTLEQTISNPVIDSLYERAMEAGALGGKLLGAGSGGFLLFFCEPHRQDRLRSALQNLQEVRFSLEPSGTRVIYVGEDQW